MRCALCLVIIVAGSAKTDWNCCFLSEDCKCSCNPDLDLDIVVALRTASDQVSVRISLGVRGAHNVCSFADGNSADQIRSLFDNTLQCIDTAFDLIIDFGHTRPQHNHIDMFTRMVAFALKRVSLPWTRLVQLVTRQI